jgi:hypothetical protein
MYRIKIIAISTFCTLLLFAFQIPIFAAESSLVFEKTDYTKQANIRVALDDKSISFDVSPQIVNGRTLVPMRAIFEALGLNVSWDATTKTAKGENSSNSISFVLGSKTATVDGQSKVLDVAANTINNRTMIPLRFLSENMGYNVVWVGESNLIMLSKSDIVEWRYQATENTPPYRIVQAKYINGTNKEEYRTIGGQYEVDQAKLKERLIANQNIPLLSDNVTIKTEEGKQNVYVPLTNLSNKSIVAMEFTFDCYDDFGRPAKYKGLYTNIFTATIPKNLGYNIHSGMSETFFWDLSQMYAVSTVNVNVKNVLFEDGSIWSAYAPNPTTTTINPTTTTIKPTINTSDDSSNSSYANERISQYERDLDAILIQIENVKNNKNVRVYSATEGWTYTYDQSEVSSLESKYQSLKDSYNNFKALYNID